MVKAKGDYEIPFDQDGNLLNVVRSWSHDPVVWKQNYKFQDKLEFLDYGISKGGASMYFQSVADGRKYQMSLGDFSDCVLQSLLIGKTIEAEFTFAKHGNRYRLKPLLPKLP